MGRRAGVVLLLELLESGFESKAEEFSCVEKKANLAQGRKQQAQVQIQKDRLVDDRHFN